MTEREIPDPDNKNPNDPQPDDYSETLIHLVEIYTLPVVLDRLGFVVYAGSAVPWPRGSAYDDVGRALREQAQEAGGGAGVVERTDPVEKDNGER